MSKYAIILIVIMAVGFLLRLVGFEFEYLFNSISDETYQNSCILRMINNKTFDLNGCQSPYPALYVFTYFPSVVMGLVVLLFKANFDLEIFKQLIAVYPLSTLPFIRLFTIIIGSSQIFLIYQITKNLFNSQTKGIVAAALMAFSLLPVQLSHWGRAWTLIMFFTLLALYFAIRIYQTGWKKYYILSALFVSWAIGVHYGGFFSIIFIFCGHFFRKIKKLFFSNQSLYLSVTVTVLLSVLWLFLNKTGVSGMFLFQPYRVIDIGQYFSSTLLFLKYFAIFDPVVFLLFIAALFINYFRKKLFTPEYLFLMLFFIFYLAGMVFLNFGPRIRWALPLIVILIPIAADLLGDLKNRIKSSALYIVLIISLLLPSLFLSAAWDYILTLPNTRFAAKDWVEKNLAPDSKILFLDETSILAVNQEGAAYLNAALAGIRPPNPRYLYLAQNGQRALPGYQVVNLQQFLDNRSFFEIENFDYYILSYGDDNAYREQITFIPPVENLELMYEIKPFDQRGQKAFNPEQDSPFDFLKTIRDIRRTGPFIEIYQKTI